MRVRSVINWIYSRFGQREFRSRDVLKGHYLPYDISDNAVYTAVHRCWKMGLLMRRKLFGNRYAYRITKWGIRYVEDGINYRDDSTREKLLGYIVDYGDAADREWAKQYLAPQLLRRFLPGKIAQDIKLPRDYHEAVSNATHPLHRRIYEELIVSGWEFIIEYYRDQAILVNANRLLQLLHPNEVHSLNTAALRIQRILLLDEFIARLQHPPKSVRIIIPFVSSKDEDRPLPIRKKSRVVTHPTKKEQARLDYILALLATFRYKELQTA
jgi:hypothetical protein